MKKKVLIILIILLLATGIFCIFYFDIFKLHDYITIYRCGSTETGWWRYAVKDETNETTKCNYFGKYKCKYKECSINLGEYIEYSPIIDKSDNAGGYYLYDFEKQKTLTGPYLNIIPVISNGISGGYYTKDFYIQDLETSKWGIYRKKVIIPCIYDAFGMRYKNNNSSEYYEFIEYTRAADFNIVALKDYQKGSSSSGKMGVIKLNGDILIDFNYEYIYQTEFSYLNRNYIAGTENEFWYVSSESGKKLTEDSYNYIKPVSEDILIVEKDKKLYVTDNYGNLLIDKYINLDEDLYSNILYDNIYSTYDEKMYSTTLFIGNTSYIFDILNKNVFKEKEGKYIN